MNEKVYLKVKGMHCHDCSAKVERSVSKMSGVTEVDIDYQTESGTVTFDNTLIELSQIFNRISKMGFEARETKKHLT
ncbi:cation transporter [Tenuibacillus multivorans]|uniref:Copper chaperone CopZ n=1 Tax=Tenuibacillus multivorans TaxID=237069 RepID=A0A1G9YHT2_9BACI|nr:heavy metal-associated domain-containing protein [Tenuibacillus multivorans]GEL78504.1 hypothetical protein TMU01_27390 [Tenuibacillus multivorans]SDN08550.1 Cu+-exporting ATPase [Tenuibacillus multivorans]